MYSTVYDIDGKPTRPQKSPNNLNTWLITNTLHSNVFDGCCVLLLEYIWFCMHISIYLKVEYAHLAAFSYVQPHSEWI